MTAITFDTLKFSETLRKSGFTEEQAKGATEALAAVHEGADLATKADISTLKSDIKELEYKIQLTEKSLTIKLGLMIAASTGIIATLIKLF